LWLTYAWLDNADHDVDYVGQELVAAGLDVKIDRWTLQAGSRLWDQLDSVIRDPSQSDAWAIYATENSLTSEPCREEYSYALDRGLSTRGGDFPLIGIFPGSVGSDLIPAGLKTRLYVSTADDDWKERVVAAVERRPAAIGRRNVKPYSLEIRQEGGRYVIEVRPRAGTWQRFFGAVPLAEKDALRPEVSYGPPHSASRSVVLTNVTEGQTDDAHWWFRAFSQQVTPTLSGYILCDRLPSAILFGNFDGGPQYREELH